MQIKDIFHISRLKYINSLYFLAVSSALAAAVMLVLWLIDGRTLGGVSVWEKPLKFFVSTVIFSLTYSWLSSFITKRIRLVRIIGHVIAASLAIELLLITVMAGLGEQSHFNVSSPLAIAIWSLMATFISIVLISTIVLSVMILWERREDLTLRMGLGLGSLNTAVGMALAFLMTSPTQEQLNNFQGIAGAHSVGVADGGPGLPFLGWSTVAGDLRVGHFFGLHSIQIAAGLLAIALLLPVALRISFIVVGNFTYLGFITILTWQALRAEPFTNPSESTLSALLILLVVSILSLLLIALIQNTQKFKKIQK